MILIKFLVEYKSKTIFSQVSAIFQRDGANIPSPLLEPPTWVRFSKNIFGGFSFMLWLGALLCFAHYSIQVIFASDWSIYSKYTPLIGQ